MNNSPGLKQFIFYLWIGAFWLLLWFFNSLLNHPQTFLLHSVNEVWHALYLVVVNFLFFEYSVPLIRRKRPVIIYNILIGILLVSLYLVLLSFGLYGWTYLGKVLHVYTSLRQSILMPGGFYNEMMYDVSYLAEAGIASAFFFGIANLLYNNFRLKLITQQQQTQMRESELNYLKSQTNPHFLFNTLNNIYVLATDKSDIAPESILRLSKILRFMLYETGARFISIEQELEIIRDYIALEKLRYDDSLNINFECEIEDLKFPLRPLLLIPLIENAFKHGVSEDIGQPFVTIYLRVTGKQLLLIVKNSIENPEKGSVKENIGLANLRRQLQLLYTDYELSVEQGETMFTATLKINFASDVYDKVHNNRR
ncbi:MAG: sensor histidine kinase [Chitinophagaceae bacterium]